MTGSVGGSLERGGVLETELKRIGTAAKEAMKKTCDLILNLRSDTVSLAAVPKALEALGRSEGYRYGVGPEALSRIYLAQT